MLQKNRLWPALFAALFTILACFSANAQEKSYLPSSAFAGFFSKPKAIMAQKQMELLPRELLQVFGKKELGIDLLEIKSIASFIDDQISKESPPDFGAVGRFDSPQKLSAKILEQFEPKDIGNGMKFYGPGNDEFAQGDSIPGFVVVDEKTLLAGTPKMIKKMLNARGAKSPLIDHMKSVPTSDHMNFFMSVEPVRALIKESLPPANQVPPQFRDFIKLPDLINSIAIRGDMAQDISQLTFTTSDDESAQEINRIIKQGIQNAKHAIVTMIAMEAKLPDEDYQDAVMKYADRIAAFVEREMKPQIHSREDGSVQLVYNLQAAGGYNSVATSGILVGMLLPAVQQVREAARRTQSLNNIRQMLIASLNYESTHRKFPAQANYDADGKPLLSWRVHILPYIEQNVLYEQFKLDEPWDSEHNIKLLDKMPPIYRNPNFASQTKTSYLGVSGKGTVFPGNQLMGMEKIRDGLSNTAMIVEASPDFAVEWTRPADLDYNEANPTAGIGSIRPGVILVGLCDGSVRAIKTTRSAEFWRNLFRIADGNVMDFLP